MKIKFTRNYTVKAVDGETYEEGKTYEMNEASCQHFINRKAAEKVTSGNVSMPAPAVEKKPAIKKG